MTTPAELNPSCPSGGDWYVCLDGGAHFVGCCTSNPCALDNINSSSSPSSSLGGCPAANLRPASFAAAAYATFPDQQCPSGGGDFYTCSFEDEPGNPPPFIGCCKSNACFQNGCPSADLTAMHMGTGDTAAAFVARIGTQGVVGTLAPTASTQSRISSATRSSSSSSRTTLSTSIRTSSPDSSESTEFAGTVFPTTTPGPADTSITPVAAAAQTSPVSKGAIAGVSVASVVLVLALAGIGFFLLARRRLDKNGQNEQIVSNVNGKGPSRDSLVTSAAAMGESRRSFGDMVENRSMPDADASAGAGTAAGVGAAALAGAGHTPLRGGSIKAARAQRDRELSKTGEESKRRSWFGIGGVAGAIPFLNDSESQRDSQVTRIGDSDDVTVAYEYGVDDNGNYDNPSRYYTSHANVTRLSFSRPLSHPQARPDSLSSPPTFTTAPSPSTSWFSDRLSGGVLPPAATAAFFSNASSNPLGAHPNGAFVNGDLPGLAPSAAQPIPPVTTAQRASMRFVPPPVTLETVHETESEPAGSARASETQDLSGWDMQKAPHEHQHDAQLDPFLDDASSHYASHRNTAHYSLTAPQVDDPLASVTSLPSTPDVPTTLRIVNGTPASSRSNLTSPAVEGNAFAARAASPPPAVPILTLNTDALPLSPVYDASREPREYTSSVMLASSPPPPSERGSHMFGAATTPSSRFYGGGGMTPSTAGGGRNSSAVPFAYEGV